MATPEEMAASMRANLLEKTGKDLAAWLDVVQASGLGKHGEIVKHLKTEHGMTHGYANLVAHDWKTRAAGGPSPDLIEAQYAGPKAGLAPIRDALLTLVAGFGGDVEVAPKKTYISLRRNKQFALIQPSTRTRVDVGINLPGTTPSDRLEASGSFNAMVSHRVRVTAVEEVDAELADWLKAAYDAS